MDEPTKELIAVGASAAVNCRPCLRYHLDQCDRLGIGRSEVHAATEVGMMVNRGAAGQTRTFVGKLLRDEQANAHVKEEPAGDCACAA